MRRHAIVAPNSQIWLFKMTFSQVARPRKILFFLPLSLSVTSRHSLWPKSLADFVEKYMTYDDSFDRNQESILILQFVKDTWLL